MFTLRMFQKIANSKSFTLRGTWYMMGMTDVDVSCRRRFTSPCITDKALFGTRQAPLVCSPLCLMPSTRKGSLSVTSRYAIVVSPLPARKSIPVSASYKGISMLQKRKEQSLIKIFHLTLFNNK